VLLLVLLLLILLLLLLAPHNYCHFTLRRLTRELERSRGLGGCSGGVTTQIISYGNIPGFAAEMRHLGDCYMKGIAGHTKDMDRAFKYYEAAAVHGCLDSSLRVGKHYLDGPDPDDGKALFFLTVAAKVCPLQHALHRVCMYAGAYASTKFNSSRLSLPGPP